MAEPMKVSFETAAADHRMNLRYLQEEGLDPLYAATHIVGFGLVVLAIQYPQFWPGGLIGVLVQAVAYPGRAIFRGNYLAQTWLLVLLWLGGILLGIGLMPELSCLLALPVGLAVFFAGWPAGILTGVAASAALLLIPQGQGIVAHDFAVLGTVWGVFVLIWLGLRPVHASIRWSWSAYDLARCQADQARDTQAELKQTVKDLAEASVQMARLNELLGAARRAAEAAERAKAEFVANVSHELRTPLNMIIGFSEMILEGSSAYGRISPTLRADLSVILRNSQHLSSLIDDVLDLSQIEAGQMALTKERAWLHEIIDAAAVATRPLFQSKGLYLQIDVPEGIEVFCDRTRIREVVLNLLSNAGRFTEEGGVHVSAKVEGAEVLVSVTDTGPGIAPEIHARLFQPFQQVDGSIRRRYGGTGLGLAISKNFVQLHGGRMWLESQVGQGSTIYFALPLEESVSTPGGTFQRWLDPSWEYRDRPWRPKLPAVTAKPRLVAVEKGNTLQRMLTRYLDGAEVTSVGSLAEAEQELERVPARAMFVSDLAVGETLESIRRSTSLPSDMPVVVCALPGEYEAAKGLGVQSYLVKPVSKDILLATLDRLQVTSGTILIVDDEPEAVRLFWRMLSASGRGYRVLTASSGQQALSILRRERPDAILLDLVMPDMDGYKFLAARDADATWRDVPTIVMSALDPAGHPIVTSALGIVRRGGLTVPQLLACLRALNGKGTA